MEGENMKEIEEIIFKFKDGTTYIPTPKETEEIVRGIRGRVGVLKLYQWWKQVGNFETSRDIQKEV
jgi:hypothetical protein